MLVVVMVIAVLAAIAYPLYTKAATKSRAIEAINLLEMVRNKQLQKYAANHTYYSSFDNMGQLTANKKNEVISGQVLKVKDYTLSLNNVHSCMTATYEKGNTKFSFSSSYEYTGLGCTGDVCSSFGDIVGTAKDVCNCGSKTCTNGYTLNEDTCNCDCYLGCNQGGTCFALYGGGQTRACSSGCGTQNSTASCSGPVWSGSCWSPTQTLATSMACTSGCGTQTRTVTCNYETGIWETSSWGTCSNQGVCAIGATQSCGGGNGTQTCSSSCAWNTCVCKSGYTLSGSTCVTSVTPKVISTSVLVDQGPSYTMCLPGTADRTQYGISSTRCSARTNQSTCYNDYLVSGDPNVATCTTISMSACPSTNYQSLCNQYGRGYKCRISASGTPNRVDYCMCDWYGSYCGEASGLSCTYTYLTASGSGSYLSCE